MSSVPCTPTPTTICPANNSKINLQGGQSGVQQSYGGSDVSWPNLLPIQVGSGYDATKNIIFNTLAGSYLDGSTYRFTRQKLDGSQTLSTTQANNYKVNQYTTAEYSLRDSRTIKSKTFQIANADMTYLADFPDPSGDNPAVSPGNDTSFNYQGNDLFQFYYGATVPATVYSGYLKRVPIGPDIDQSNCQVAGTLTDCQCGDNVMNDSSVTDLINSILPAFIPKTFFVEWPGYNSASAMGPTTQTPASCGSLDGNYAVSAHMRDGFSRLNVNGSKDCGGVSETWYTTESINWTTKLSTQGTNSLAFPSQTCSSNYQKPSAHYLLDSDGSSNRTYFLQLQIHDLPSTIYFAETAQDQNKNTLLKSFNITGRFPGCLTNDESAPSSTSPYLATQSTDYIKVGATLGTQTTDFTFDVPVNLGGSGSSNPGQTYKPSDGYIWDSDKLSDWPSTTAVRSGVPDIVARVVFYNPDIFQPWDGTTPTLSDIKIRNFQTTTQNLFLQNTPHNPSSSSTTCDQLYVHAFERGVAFLEFLATIAYSIMYAYNLDQASTQGLYFETSYNVYVPNSTYTMTDFLKHLYTRMSVQLSSSKTQPSLLDPSQESSLTASQEFDAWVLETLNHTSNYLAYPSFSINNQKLYVSAHFHPMMHASLVALTQDDRDEAVAIYLNNFFQDFSSQINTSTIIQNTKTYGVVGSLSVQKGDNFYAGTTAIRLEVQNANQTDQITLSNSPQNYNIGYIYTAELVKPSVGTLLFLLQNQPDLPITNDMLATNLSLPTVMSLASSTVQNCMTQKPITQACIDDLCASQSNCLCDFSVVIGTQKTKNPQSSKYLNNSNGPCACLASDAYPQGSQLGRAKNPVSRCFAKACADFPKLPDGYCASQACTTLTQTMHDRAKGPGNWFDLFPDGADKELDLNKLNSTCHTNYVTKGDLEKDPFQINYYIMGGSLGVALAAPLALALDYFGMRQRRPAWVYWFWLGIIVFLMAVAGILWYALSGKYVCSTLNYSDDQVAPCRDRLTQSIELTPEACDPHPPLFCQCAQSGSVCTDYVPKNKEYQAQCTDNGTCAMCPNNLYNLDLTTSHQNRTRVPTTWTYLAFGVWCVAAGLICTTLGSYFKNLGLKTPARIGLLVFISILLGILALGALVAGRNHTQSTTISIDTKSQIKAASATKDPCDAN